MDGWMWGGGAGMVCMIVCGHVRVGVKERRERKRKRKRAKVQRTNTIDNLFLRVWYHPIPVPIKPIQPISCRLWKMLRFISPQIVLCVRCHPSPASCKTCSPYLMFHGESHLSLPKSDYKSIIFYRAVSDPTNPPPLGFKDKWGYMFQADGFPLSLSSDKSNTSYRVKTVVCRINPLHLTKI